VRDAATPTATEKCGRAVVEAFRHEETDLAIFA
jgi:hypothetical protein